MPKRSDTGANLPLTQPNNTEEKDMGIKDMLTAPSTGSGTVRDNPKAHFIAALDAQRENPTWVNAMKNEVGVRPGNRMFFPIAKGSTTVNQVFKGSQTGADYSDKSQYHSLLNQIQTALDNGELDTELATWAARFK